MEIDISISQLKSTYNSYFNSVEQEYNAKKDEKNSKNGQNSKEKAKNVSDSDEEEDIVAPVAAAASSDLFEMSDSMNGEFENNNIDNDNDNNNNKNDESSRSNNEEEEEEEKKVFGMNEVATDAPPGWTFDTLEEEIEYLRNVNLRLRYELEISNANTNQNDGGIGGISSNNGGSSIYYKNKKDLTYKKLNKDKKVSFEMNKAFLNNAKVSPYEFSQRVQSKLPQFLRNEEAKLQLNKENKNNENDNGNVRLLNGDKMDDTTKKDTIYIPSMVENEIGIIDIKQVDWWDIVDYDSIDCDNDYLKSNLNNTVDGQSVTDQMVFNNGVALDGPFVLVRESDVVDAVACFVAQCVIKMPECRNLSHDQMLKLLDGTFAELREKGPIGKMIQWGQMGYSVYGYGKYAWTLYTNPLVAETILAALAQAIIFFGVL